MSSTATQASGSSNVGKNSVLFFEGVEDAIQSGVGEMIDVYGAHANLGTPPRIRKSHIHFQNDLKEVIRSEWFKRKQFIMKWKGRIADYIQKEPEYFDKYNPNQMKYHVDKVIQEFEKGPFRNPKPIDKDELAKKLERGFWAMWLPKLIGTQWRRGALFMPIPPEIKKPKVPVEKRLDELGISQESGVEDFGYYTTTSEIRLAVEWARKWKPKKSFG